MAEVVVTGAAGFLGSHLVDSLLGRGWKVSGIDNLSTGRPVNLSTARHRPGFSFRRLDLARAERLPRAAHYYHLASPASPPAYQRDPIATLTVNSAGTYRVLETARRWDARVLLASTSEVYGDPEIHPQTEDYWGHVNPVGLRSCYDEGKRFAEALGMAYRRQYGMDVRIARIFNTYGPRMDPKDGRIISNFITQGLTNQPFTIYGRGEQTRSFCYVSDLVRGLRLLMAADSGVPTPMNLGNPREFTVRRTADLVARTLGVPLRIQFHPLPEDDPRQRSPSIRRARRHLGWSPRVSLENGFAKTAAYFRSLDLTSLGHSG
ncbi:MAG: NAD-dependent epimerase/dehydratase family protein [Thermoplasmata archaeon]